MCRSEQLPAAEIVLGREHEDIVGTAIMRFPRDHPLLGEAEKAWRESWSVDRWAFSGPQLMSRLVQQFGLDREVALQRDLYPVAWPQALELFDPARRAQVERAIAGKPFLHVWLSMLPRHGLPRDSIPPSGSALHILIDRYLQGEGGSAEGTFINDVLASRISSGAPNVRTARPDTRRRSPNWRSAMLRWRARMASG
jgi:hypothetical protein